MSTSVSLILLMILAFAIYIVWTDRVPAVLHILAQL